LTLNAWCILHRYSPPTPRWYVKQNTATDRVANSCHRNNTKLTQQKHVFTNQNECTTTQNKPKNLKPGLVAFYDIQLGNREGLFWFWCFIHLSLTYLDTHPFTAPGPTWGCTLRRHVLRSNPAVPHVHVTTQSLTAVLPL